MEFIFEMMNRLFDHHLIPLDSSSVMDSTETNLNSVCWLNKVSKVNLTNFGYAAVQSAIVWFLQKKKLYR